MSRFVIAMGLALAGLLGSSAGWADESAPAVEIKHRWVFTMTNLANPDALQKTIDLMRRGKAAGYNGILVADSKFAKFQLQDKSYAQKVGKLRQDCTDAEMALIVDVCPMGYAAELLAANPNLAEGMPVRKAAFTVRQGRLEPDREGIDLVNGKLTEWKKGSPQGWTVDKPGSVSFRDDEVTYQGTPSLRQNHAAAKGGPVRMIQRIPVKPWHYYHLSAMVKTKDCTSKDFRVFALANPDYPLNWQPPEIEKTMDWKRVQATFCSADNTELAIYLGSYNPKGGTIWWSRIELEPGGFVNAIRRPDLPLKVTSEDGQTTFAEGRDFTAAVDPKLGHDPNPGYFTVWHDAPQVTIPTGSRLIEGQRVLASYHFATIAGKGHQINCCFSEPAIYDLLRKQVRWVADVVKPDVFMMGHDEIRHSGWDDSCTRRGLTCGQILADNVRQCTEMIHKAAPGKQVATWNDMFDPFHNAHKDGWMYLAKGKGPWYGSWEGLPSDVLVLNWHNNDMDSLKFFAERGHAQVLAGFYDADPVRIVEWLEMASKVRGVNGVMYTTWVNDYSKLEKFMEHVRSFEAKAKAAK